MWRKILRFLYYIVTNFPKFVKLYIQHLPTIDQITDLNIFLRDKRNLMDPSQLAKEQLAAQQIYVIAPKPLETINEEVFKSTVEWLQRHIDDNMARMIFWTAASDEDDPPLVTIVQRLLPILNNDLRVLQRIECVQAPDKFFLIDYTIWRYSDGKTRAFVNERQDGVTARLFEISEQSAQELISKLDLWLNNCKDDTLVIPKPGLRVAGLQEETVPNSIQRRIITSSCEAEGRPSTKSINDHSTR